MAVILWQRVTIMMMVLMHLMKVGRAAGEAGMHATGNASCMRAVVQVHEGGQHGLGKARRG